MTTHKPRNWLAFFGSCLSYGMKEKLEVARYKLQVGCEAKRSAMRLGSQPATRKPQPATCNMRDPAKEEYGEQHAL
jgi:hypothetical protein